MASHFTARSSKRGNEAGDKAGDELPTAAAFMPARLSLPQLRQASATCRGCPLYRNATQTVFGDGPADASVMLVGETPGDREDRTGKPFVGPAGNLLDRALAEAQIDRGEVYLTNAVKHFKFEPRGKHRIHRRPSAREIQACLPWLKSEIATVKPKLLVCLGATAAQALLGKAFRVTRSRGQVLRDTPWAPAVVATVHPSSILRAPDDAARQRGYREFVADLKVVKREMQRITDQQAISNARQRAQDVSQDRRAHLGQGARHIPPGLWTGA
ncbi:UdgX family uracil-DNA binding protein [Fontivita pretiosa]|uniref:UdgX family uracil-DNA binding protein n=1 Tax=Fontivita pretiosa TaxID=2989684 RepID=UPI003D17F87D